jgi:methylated-DNA-[protein]-cysteine S-methyltransferase
MNTRHTVIDTEIGELTLVARDDSLTGLYFPGHWTKPDRSRFGALVLTRDDRLLARAQAQLRDYLAGQRTAFEIPLALDGDGFQRQVWALLQEIPFGDTTTYGALAERLGDKRRAWSVGQAVAHNPVSIIVPCHRVLGKDGRLTGYAGGPARKRFLLALEEPALVAAGRLF